MIDEKKLLTKLAEWEKESSEEAGLKAPTLLRKVMEEVQRMAVNEEIRERIEAETESHAMKWVSVVERLPKCDREVIVQWEKMNRISGETMVFLDIMHLDDKGVWNSCQGVPNGQVIAWMPLPEPYRKEREENGMMDCRKIHFHFLQEA